MALIVEASFKCWSHAEQAMNVAKDSLRKLLEGCLPGRCQRDTVLVILCLVCCWVTFQI